MDCVFDGLFINSTTEHTVSQSKVRLFSLLGEEMCDTAKRIIRGSLGLC